MLNFNGSEIQHVFFDGLDIDIVNINGVKVFEAVRKTEYDPVLMTRTVTPYGEDVAMDITDIQEGGHIDAASIVSSGSIPVSNLSLSGNRLSFRTANCNKGVTGKIQVPVVGCKDYFDYLIPIDLDSCTHPSSKLTYHSGSSASCTASGTAAYYTCSCDAANHTLNSAGNEISTYIAPLGHSFTTETIYDKTRQLRSAATCGAYASYWRECTRCTVHSTTQWFYDYSSTRPAHNNTNSGYSSYYCTVCGTTGYSLLPSSPTKKTSTMTITGSSMKGTNNWECADWNFSTTVGKTYKISFSVTNITSPGCQVFILPVSGSTTGSSLYRSSWVQSGSLVNTVSITATTSTTLFRIHLNNSSTTQSSSCNFQMIAYPAG